MNLMEPEADGAEWNGSEASRATAPSSPSLTPRRKWCPVARVRTEVWLLAAYVVVWVALAIDPKDRVIWFFENLLVFLGIPLLLLTAGRFRFSTPSYACAFAFLLLHAVGAHYGYTQVPLPWEDWGFGRNHSDRVVHFAFGLLAAVPVEELLRRLGRIGPVWGEGLAVASTFALAAGFEIVEWAAVLVGGDAVGARSGGYLGTQGDEFDAVKDMALGLAGAMVSMAALLAVRGWTSRRSR